MRRLALLALCLALTGCPALWAALPRVAAGASMIGSLLDVAAAGADAYLARHPSQDTEQQVAVALRRAQAAVAALHAAALAATAAEDGDLAKARTEALDAYGALRALLDAAGILDATPPLGGAEGSAPLPEPVYLPDAATVDALLGPG